MGVPTRNPILRLRARPAPAPLPPSLRQFHLLRRSSLAWLPLHRAHLTRSRLGLLLHLAPPVLQAHRTQFLLDLLLHLDPPVRQAHLTRFLLGLLLHLDPPVHQAHLTRFLLGLLLHLDPPVHQAPLSRPALRLRRAELVLHLTRSRLQLAHQVLQVAYFQVPLPPHRQAYHTL